ncbi:MAG: hypothetical protein ACREH4_04335 [Vitreimonas sp.]
MKPTLAAALAAALAFSPQLALAQEPEVVVEGRQQEEAIREFIGTASAAVSADNQLAMWQGDICPGILGIRREQAQAFIDRIALRAYQFGIETGASGCDPNVFIFFAPDANAFTRQLFENDRSLFAYFYEQNISTRGHEALADFLNTPRPVRWWHVSRRTTGEGIRLASSNAREGVPGHSAFRDVQSLRSTGSRLRQAIRQEFARAIVVVDASQTAGIPLPAVADYVAMIALAQIEPDAALSGHATILNLFTAPDEARPNELTAWDLAYLQSLYSATPESASTALQFGEMTHRMERELAPQD